MATNEQTRKVDMPNVPPPFIANGAPKNVPGKPMQKKNGDDAKWLAGLAAVVGLGLGGAAYAAGTYDSSSSTDDEFADAEAQVDAAVQANKEAADEVLAAAKVEEPQVVEVHHYHSTHGHAAHAPHAPHTPAGVTPTATPATAEDIKVVDYMRITTDEGGYMDRCDIKVGDQDAYLLDTDGDGYADKLCADVDGNGMIAGEQEIIDLREAGYEIPMRDFAQEIGFDYDTITDAYADANGYQKVDDWYAFFGSDGYEDDDVTVADSPEMMDGDGIVADEVADDDVAIADNDVELLANQDFVSEDNDVIVVDMGAQNGEELMDMEVPEDDSLPGLELVDDAPGFMDDNSFNTPNDDLQDMAFADTTV